MFWNKSLQMDPYVSRLVSPVTNTVIYILLFFLGVKCDVLWDSQEQALNEQQIWIFGLAEGGWGRVFLAEYGSCCSTLAEQCIVLDMINRCEQPAFNCLLLTWRCLTEGKESPLGLSKGVSECRRVCACVTFYMQDTLVPLFLLMPH